MSGTVYLEASARTQDLLSAKWTFLSCGYEIGSTWHDDPVLGSSGLQAHWAAARLEELKSCDTVLIVRGQEKELAPQLAFMAGYAAAHNLTVLWLGLPMDLPGHSRKVHYFATLDDLRRELLERKDQLATRASDGRIAA